MIATLTLTEITDFLTSYDYGHIGCTDGNKVYIVPVSYKYLGDYFLVHSREGEELQIMRGHPYVCFQVDQVTDYTHWHCVIAWGNYEEIKGDKEREDAKVEFDDPNLNVKAALSQHPNENGVHEMVDTATKPLVFYKIKVTEISGRYEYGELISRNSV